MFVARALSVLLLAASVAAFSVDECKDGLREARNALRFMAENMVEKEHAGYREKFSEFMKAKYESESPTFALFEDFDAASPAANCPPTNMTIFPTSTSTAAPVDEEEEELVVPSLLRTQPEKDPFVWFVSSLHKALSKEDEVCDGPEFTSLASITEDQVLGFSSVFLTRDSAFLCPLCHHVVDHLRPKILGANFLIHADDEVMFRNLVSSQLPSTKAICSTALPVCYKNYHDDYHIDLPGPLNKGNMSKAMKCAACGVCMTATTILEHKVLLAEKTVKVVQQLLNETIFYNVCGQLCKNPPQIFSKFTFPGCMKTMNEVFTFGVKALQRIAMPNHLCALELGFCEPNATPNLLHCLPDICKDVKIVRDLLGDLCTKASTDLPKEFLDRLNIPAEEYEKTLQRMRMFDEL